MWILASLFALLSVDFCKWGLGHDSFCGAFSATSTASLDGTYKEAHNAGDMAQQTGASVLYGNMIYDALIVGGGPAGLSAALAIGRAYRSALLFDSGRYRNQGGAAMHTVLSRDGIHPEEFRKIARSQIERYPTISFKQAHIAHAANVELEPGYKGFELKDGDGNIFRGRKLVLATGSEDVLPDNIEGYRENWPQHM